MKIDWRQYPDGNGFYAYVKETEMTLEYTCGLNGFWTGRAFKGGEKIHEDGAYTSRHRVRVALQKWMITQHVEKI